MRRTRFVFQRVLDELKRRAKREHPLNRSRVSDLQIVVGCFRNVLTGRQIAETLRHMRKSVIRLEKTARFRIDEGDTAGHVGQDFFVKDDFALDAPFGFHLALIKPAGKPCTHGDENDQPGRQYGHSPEEIVDRFVSEAFRLLYDRHPASRFYRAERIEVSALLEMPALVLADFLDQNSSLG